MREEELGALPVSTLKDIYIPEDVCARLQALLEKDRVKASKSERLVGAVDWSAERI